MSNYLVLGGSGLIGNSLINFLERMGHSVTNIDIQNGLKFDLRTMLIPEIDKFSGCFF